MTEPSHAADEKDAPAEPAPAPAADKDAAPGEPAPAAAADKDAAPEAMEPSADDNDDDESPLSARLSMRPPEPPVSQVPVSQRVQDANGRLGSMLKGWRLDRLLGVGATTASFEAIKGAGDAGERAVIRVLAGDVAKSERARSHFLRSSYASGRFTHPRVVPVTADGVDDEGIAFTVRPWVHGEPLPAYARVNPMDEQRVLRVAEQLLDILEIAHAHGIVHGDLRPENVLITSRGSARLIDFATPPGLSARADAESPLGALRMGPFTAPERCVAEGGVANEQSDVWSVGAVMFFALTGEPPRPEGNGLDALARPPRGLADVLPEASVALASVIDHALESDPSLRYDSAYAMLGDVRRVAAGRPPKLAKAAGAVPSGVLSDGPPSTVRPAPFRSIKPNVGGARGPKQQQAGSQWRGNLTLVVLIAALLASATYVMFREKTEAAPPTPASAE